MKLTTLEAIISLKESSQVEYKKAKNDFPKDAWKSYSAFANTTGGYLILGISEDECKKPVLTGVKDAEKIISDFCSTLGDRSKVSLNIIENEDIRTAIIEDKTIVIIHIKEAAITDKPVYLNNNLAHTYIRLHSQDHLVDTQQLSTILRNQSDQLDYELLHNYDISDLDLDSINSYKSILSKRYPSLNYSEMDNQSFLENIGVFRKNRNTNKIHLTVDGLLFFGKYNSIIDRFPHYHVDFFDKRGNSQRWSFRIESGNLDFPDLNLFNYYRLVSEKLLLSVNRNFELDEYTIRKNPTDLTIALREAFVNMIIHADYFLNTTALIAEIHEPFYIFINPGIMKIPVKEFFTGGARSLVRNPLLVSLFTRMGASEHAGSGSQKIIDVVVKNRFKVPELKSDLERTYLKLWIAEPLVDVSNLKEDEKKVYTFICNPPTSNKSSIKFTKKEIANAHPDITSARLTRILNKLSEQNLIVKMGAYKNRTYVKAVSSVEVIHHWGETYDIIKHLFYKDKSDS